ncbi:HAD family hydrolase [Paracoccus indicus]|uniref:HAD family hydrolase n=1 Tax=Paracoccus indicus TaxID=2079229 RepID=UPI000D39C89B|nr:HAD family hydrolase [Paracoccus indicus]
MRILHVALGGCLKAPPVKYGITEDTGGHIAYVLGAAMAQARNPAVRDVQIVTRAFLDPGLDPVHAEPVQNVAPRCTIRRLVTGDMRYLSKEALQAHLPELSRAFCDMLRETTEKPDVIHAHFADAAVLARAAHDEFAIPWTYTPHSLALQKSGAADCPELRDRIVAERAAVAGAGAIIVSSRDEAERQLLPYGADSEGRTHRINPGVSLDRDLGTAAARALIAPFLRDADKPILLAIARPVRKKNLGALIEAYAASPALQERANLVIVAGLRNGINAGPEEQMSVIRDLFDRVDRHGLWGKVALPARHDGAQIRSLYALAERGGVFVNPALHEPFGLTLIEAAQAGVPVVATRDGGPVDILQQLDAGKLVDPTDPADIADACLQMLRHPRRDWLAQKARHKARAAFNWDRWAAAAVQVYDGLRPAALQKAAPVRRILASDIDGTLTGCATAARQFGTWHDARPEGLMFAVATGRSAPEARRVLREWHLPQPDLFITSVGSEIWRPDGQGGMRLCQAYADHLSQDWDRDAVMSVLLATGIPLQPHYEQRRWKLSLFGNADAARSVEDALSDAGLTAHVIASHGRFIDILPVRAGKAAALRFEAERFGLTLADCVTAGDSGNDRDMLIASGASILPANAYSELSGITGLDIFRSSDRHAAGVLDGLTRLGLTATPKPGVHHA